MLGHLATGCLLGLSAGVSPGPLLSLVVTESVRAGPAAGLRVAAAPLVTDVPIVFVCTLALTQVARTDAVLGGISLAGGGFVLWLAWDAWRARPPSTQGGPVGHSLLKGVLTNFLSPHPYLFWLTVGSPLLVTGWRDGPSSPVLFLAGFYGLLVGSKAAIAVIAGRGRHLLSGRGYRWLLRSMGVLLVAFAALLFREGWLLLVVGR